MFMSKVGIVYWSGTGNTEAMAHAVEEGAKAAGANVTLFTAGEFSGSMVHDFDALAFGCPSMGVEQLEESEFEPMYFLQYRSYHYANAFPSVIQAAFPLSSGASLQITLSAASTAPADRHLSSQERIHSPSPQP